MTYITLHLQYKTIWIDKITDCIENYLKDYVKLHLS